MSDSDTSDGIADLENFLDEYESRNPETKAEVEKNQENDTKGCKRNVEVPMDKILFGDKKRLIENLVKTAGESLDKDDGNDNSVEEQKKAPKRKPAWVDDDDENLHLGDVKRETRFTGSLGHLNMDKKYKDHLTERFKKIVAQPKWALLDRKKEVDSDSDEELLKTVGFLEKAAKSVLAPTIISIKRLKDLNRAAHLEKRISSINFHPTSTAAMVTGLNGYATIYSIDGEKNEKLHSMRFKDFPITCAQIYPCGTKAIFGSKRNFYYRYDLLNAQENRCTLPKFFNSSCRRLEVSPCGRYIAVIGRIGEVHLLTANSNEVIHTFKQPNLTAHDFCFTSDSSKLICNDYSCNLTVFSIRQRRMEHKFIDDGCITGEVVRLSPNQRMLATGSREGVVNIYDFDNVFKSTTPAPIKRFFNLTTGISDLTFNHSSEILAMCSGKIENAVKLAHFPSASVYSNFPANTLKLGKIPLVKFSPSSGFLALGTIKKEVPLFRIKYFKNY